MNKVPYILLIAVVLMACSGSKTCQIADDIALQIGFYSDSIDSAGNRVEYVKPIDSITVQGIGSDSILYNNTKNATSISLPLHNTLTTTSYALIVNGMPDTLTVNHQNNDFFVSMECGCFTYHVIEDVTETANLFDSVAYINFDIGRTQTENIRLFRH